MKNKIFRILIILIGYGIGSIVYSCMFFYLYHMFYGEKKYIDIMDLKHSFFVFFVFVFLCIGFYEILCLAYKKITKRKKL